jgi:hypothetical protein
MPRLAIVALTILIASSVAGTAGLSAQSGPADMDIRELMQRNPYPQDPCDRVPPPTRC